MPFIIFLFFSFAIYANEKEERFDDFKYAVKENEVTITQYMGRTRGKITIPQEILGMPVVAIAESAMDGKDFTEISLPETLCSIGKNALRGTRISSISIPNSVTEIGEGAFSDCNHLRIFSISPNHPVYAVLDGVLYDKSKKMLHTFLSYDERETFEIPKGILSIGNSAFAYNRELQTITIADTVTSIGDYAFFNSMNIKKVSFLFVKEIGRCAFEGCKKLEEFFIPESLISIGQGAFRLNNAYSWKDFNLTVHESNPAFSAIENVLFDKSGQVLVAYFSLNNRNKSSRYYTVPEGVVHIDDSAFYATTVHSVTLPGTLRTIGKEAFSSPVLSEVIMQVGIETIGEGAFRNSKKLILTELPKTVETIEDGAFQGCTKIESLRLHSSLTYIGHNVFTKAQETYAVSLGGSFGQDPIKISNLNISLVVDQESYAHMYAIENNLVHEFVNDTSWL